MTLGVVVTAHQTNVEPILKCLAEQTRLPSQVALLYSDTAPPEAGDRPFFLRSWRRENRSDWGHEKRDEGWRLLDTDYVAFVNADDSYAPEWVEEMMKEAEAEPVAGLVYCYWRQGENGAPIACAPSLGSSTSGNFIVARSVLAATEGWTDRTYEADGRNIEKYVGHCGWAGMKVSAVPLTLYSHNVR